MFSYAAVPPPTRLYWRCQLIGWSLYFVICLVAFAFMGAASADMVKITLAIAATMLAITHWLRYHLRANKWEQLPPLPLLGRLLVAHALLSLLSQVIIGALIIVLIKPAPDGNPHGWAQFFGYAINVNILLWLWAGFYFGWHYLTRYKQAEVDKWKLATSVQEAEMRTLKAQINPHFMFNGLNNIRALVMEDPGRARDMITHLSDLLRYSIQLNSAEQVPLGRELEIVEHYLQLEALQLEERLTYSLDVDPAALPVQIPPMTLQLLVENAIKHGISPRPEGGFIRLRAQLAPAAHNLHIEVRSTGQYQPQPGHEGVGLRNARERLALLYGASAALRITNDPAQPEVVVAELQLPFIAAPVPSLATSY
ncbi:histidine kinase [Hymenobacter taeanensis]|uniref:Histidine kinase n=1 Tax=Hymenobacter taeanensis TaxID=2735321 RepID=A0A6M6BH72_9BACT|nr:MULTISPECIES: histidine kinase [Hymenobacter]QJX47911.1 histidine kinase [Hymenobacter taeanensis]UOQ82645.1 histidine kinase [Hymenobacter sp. 5414T-23]